MSKPTEAKERLNDVGYKTRADYDYIKMVAQTLRDTAKDNGLNPIPIFGNGDAYDYRTYYENMESSGVDGIMIARGALIKVSFDFFTTLMRADVIGTAMDFH